MNFDGAAKGNSGPAGFGGIFRSHEGANIHIYFGSLGRDYNNAAELEGLWQGICIAERENIFPLEVEGDSQILIEAEKRLQSSSSASNIASSWRLQSRLEIIEKWLRTPKVISFKNVRIIANKVADRLANQGSLQTTPFYEGLLENSNDVQLIQDCTSLVHQDIQVLDAGGRNVQ